MRFIYVPAPHTAEVICEQFYEAFVEWNLDEKVSTLTLDNCTTNDKAITELGKKIGKPKLMLEGKLLHMHCAAHILNLIVKDCLEVIKDSIAKIRESIAFWTATSKRVEKFDKIAKHVKVKMDHKLGLDCKTRWNSTYKMLSIALPSARAFDRARRVEKLFDCAPSEEEWAFATEVVNRLKLFNDITEIFSGTNYVTANVQPLKICEAKEQIRQWAACGNTTIEEMLTEMIAKFDKYWKEIQESMGLVTILDPRFKTDYLLGFIETITSSSSEECADKLEVVKNDLYELMKDELVSINMENFKILDWWKVAGTQYPTLRKVARDIIAIPVSTVASEAAFSTSGRVLSEHRSRLTSDILEALMCFQNWLRNKYKDADNEKAASFWRCLQEIQDKMGGLALV